MDNAKKFKELYIAGEIEFVQNNKSLKSNHLSPPNKILVELP